MFIQTKSTVPVWFMRQAGRYHTHYQGLRKAHGFMKLCKDPNLACEVTMGPIQDFNFDAAILFSDLLFPLEALNMGLDYLEGPPRLGFHLEEKKDWDKLSYSGEDFFNFQKDALGKIRKTLPSEKTLLGFVGAPFTLFAYAVNGAHAGQLIKVKQALYAGDYSRWNELMIPILMDNLRKQAEGGANALCLFDTASGELSLQDYKKFVVPSILQLTKKFKEEFPDLPLIYYSRQTHLDYYLALEDENIDVLGVDWRFNLSKTLTELGKDYIIQGNLDPVHLFLPWDHLERSLEEIYKSVSKTKYLDKWIFGLGHGVLPKTPEENVRKAVQYVHEYFRN